MYLTAILPLLLLLLLLNHRNEPITTHAASLIHAPTPIIPTCWDDTTRFQPVIFRECISIINHDIFSSSHDPDIPLKFSFDPKYEPDIKLPKYWIRPGVNCGVGIDLAPGVEGWDRTTLRDIQTAAKAVAIKCVIKGSHTGGFIQIGWHKKLGVLISGRRGAVLGNVNSTRTEQ